MENEEIKRVEDLIIKLVKEALMIYKIGEGNLTVEFRNDGGERKAKIKSEIISRV